MDNSFRYKNQIVSYMNLKLIFPHRSYLSKKIKIKICNSLVLSHFSFCSPIYDACITNELSMKIQVAQNSCLRLIYGVRKYQHISHKLKEAHWLNMANRRFLTSACLYHSIISEKEPINLYKKILFRGHAHNINVRHKHTITPPAHKTALFERSFSYQISKVYNNLPANIKQ